jgi:hypothetical protein
LWTVTVELGAWLGGTGRRKVGRGCWAANLAGTPGKETMARTTVSSRSRSLVEVTEVAECIL